MSVDTSALRARVVEKIEAASFYTEDVGPRMVAGLTPVIGIHIDEACPGRGLSKIGGKPHLPPDTAWPTDGDEPLAFIGQLNFADVAPHDFEGIIPPSGLLSIFCTYEEMMLEMEPDHRLLFTNVPNETLVELEFPDEIDEVEGRFEEHALRFNPSFVLANPDDPDDEARYQYSDEKTFAAILEDLGLGNDTRLFGRPYFFREEFEDVFDADEDVMLFELFGDQLDREGGEGSIYGEGVLRVFVPREGLESRRFNQAGLWFEGGT